MHPGGTGVEQLLPPLSAHAAFGGYKKSGIGRENHKMTLDHYQQTKNVLCATMIVGAVPMSDLGASASTQSFHHPAPAR
jgi:hypothetical protein